MLKIALVLIKNMFFGLKKGISGLGHWITPKHTASGSVLMIKFLGQISLFLT